MSRYQLVYSRCLVCLYEEIIRTSVIKPASSTINFQLLNIVSVHSYQHFHRMVVLLWDKTLMHTGSQLYTYITHHPTLQVTKSCTWFTSDVIYKVPLNGKVYVCCCQHKGSGDIFLLTGSMCNASGEISAGLLWLSLLTILMLRLWRVNQFRWGEIENFLSLLTFVFYFYIPLHLVISIGDRSENAMWKAILAADPVRSTVNLARETLLVRFLSQLLRPKMFR